LAVFHLGLGYLAVAQSNGSVKPEGKVLKLMTYNLKFASPTFQPSWEVRRDMQSFQLSETPEIIGSGPEVNPRMVTWVRLAFINRPNEGEKSPNPQDFRGHWENNREFYVFNTHFFNGPDASLAKLNASKLILKRINALNRFGEWRAERPLFLLGDFNCRPGTPPYRILVGDKNSTDTELLKNTFEDLNKIDWILYKGAVKVLKYEEVTYNVNGVYPSDHKPIYVEVEIPGK
jgi:hypothetical protein